MKRKIILGVILLIVVGGSIAYWIVFKSRADIVQDKPDVQVTAANLVAAFEKDTAAASKQYMDKVVEISGNVKRIDTSGAVILGEETSPSEVVVAFDQMYHKKDYESLVLGKPAVLQGICSGYTISGTDPDDLLSGLGTTIQIRSAGVKSRN